MYLRAVVVSVGCFESIFGGRAERCGWSGSCALGWAVKSECGSRGRHDFWLLRKRIVWKRDDACKILGFSCRCSVARGPIYTIMPLKDSDHCIFKS